MFIYPNSTIKVLKDVPLDPTFDHTIYFSTVNDQVNYFNTKVKQLSGYSFVFNNQTYQRVKRGWMRLQMPSELLYDCNYIMFQNTAFGTKWFYAFLTAVEYVNNNVSEVRFQIDPMQTWE